MTFDLAPTDPSGAYVVSVMPLAAGVQIESPPGRSGPVDITILAPPRDVTVDASPGRVRATWKSGGIAFAQQVEVSTANRTFVSQQTLGAGEVSTAFTGDQFAPSAKLQLRVGAIARAHAEPIWSEPVAFVIPEPKIPAAYALIFGAAGLEAQWLI